MGLFSSTPSPLQQLGFKQKAKIIIEGEDDSGKKTLLLRLADLATEENHHPFIKFGSVQVEKVRFQLAGIRNEFNARATWQEDIEAADAIIYLIDVSNSGRMKNVSEQLKRVIELTDSKNTPVLVLGNKIDKQGALTETELNEQIKLKGFQSMNRVKIVMCSLLNRTNLSTGLQWLANSLK